MEGDEDEDDAGSDEQQANVQDNTQQDHPALIAPLQLTKVDCFLLICC